MPEKRVVHIISPAQRLHLDDLRSALTQGGLKVPDPIVVPGNLAAIYLERLKGVQGPSIVAIGDAAYWGLSIGLNPHDVDEGRVAVIDPTLPSGVYVRRRPDVQPQVETWRQVLVGGRKELIAAYPGGEIDGRDLLSDAFRHVLTEQLPTNDEINAQLLDVGTITTVVDFMKGDQTPKE